MDKAGSRARLEDKIQRGHTHTLYIRFFNKFCAWCRNGSLFDAASVFKSSVPGETPTEGRCLCAPKVSWLRYSVQNPTNGNRYQRNPIAASVAKLQGWLSTQQETPKRYFALSHDSAAACLWRPTSTDSSWALALCPALYAFCDSSSFCARSLAW